MWAGELSLTQGGRAASEPEGGSPPAATDPPPLPILPPSHPLTFSLLLPHCILPSPPDPPRPSAPPPPFLPPPLRPTFQTVLRRLTEMRQALPGPTPPFSAYEIITDVMEQLAEKKVKSQKRKVSDACARMQLVATPCTSTHSHYVHTYATMWLPGPLSRCLNDAFDPTHCTHL